MSDDDTEQLLPSGDGTMATSIQIEGPNYVTDSESFADSGIQSQVTTVADPASVDTALPDDRPEEDAKAVSFSFTTRQKLTFLGLAISYFASLMSLSVLAPFFPIEAEKKGVSPTLTGFVFGAFAIVAFLTSPIHGKYLPVVGGKFMFLSGSFVAAGCNLLFGFLDEIHDETTFVVYCFVIRMVEAVGASATITAGMAISANAFPENVAQAGGMLEIFSGLGFALGPPLGSLFYGIGGYKLPFIVLGCSAMVVAGLNMLILPSIGRNNGGEEGTKAGSLMSILRIPAVWMTCLSCVLGSASLGFSDPTLSLHLTDPPLSLKPSMVGYLFLLIGGLYAAGAPFWGYFADKKKLTRIMMALGFYGTGVSFMLMGPSPLLNLPNQLWIIVISLSLLGLSIGMAVMPAYLDLLISAKWYGLKEDLSTQALVSGVFNGAFSFGTFLGPTLAGSLVNAFGFDWSATIFAGCNFLVMIMICLFGVWEYQCGKGRRKPKHMLGEPYPEISSNGSAAVTT